MLSAVTIARTKHLSGLDVDQFDQWPRLQQCARLAALGWTDKAIAVRLGVTWNTVKSYFRIYRQELGIPHRVCWVAFALRQGVVTLDELYAELDKLGSDKGCPSDTIETDHINAYGSTQTAFKEQRVDATLLKAAFIFGLR